LPVLAGCSLDEVTSPRAPRAVTPTNAVGADSLQAAAPFSNRFAYVWENNPTSASYTPNAQYAYNATGGAIVVTRGGTGSYTVKFGNPSWWNVGTLGFAVTPYGSSTNECQMRNYLTSGNTLVVYVFCFDRVTLASADSRF